MNGLKEKIKSAFLSRWPLLTTMEISAVQEWLQWYFDEEFDQWSNSHEICFATLELLKSQKQMEVLLV